jgi:hypothetical protein
MLKCKTCANSIFDEIWGEYKCKIHKIRIYKVCSKFAAECLDYKQDLKKSAEEKE